MGTNKKMSLFMSTVLSSNSAVINKEESVLNQFISITELCTVDFVNKEMVNKSVALSKGK